MHELKERYQKDFTGREADKETKAKLGASRRKAIHLLGAKKLTVLAQVLKKADIDIAPAVV